jgi:hypothetical protein
LQLSAFGLAIETDVALPVVEPAAQGELLSIVLAHHEELAALAEEPRVLRYLHVLDNCAYAMLEGAAGDLLICYGYRALFHLSADGRTLRCAPTQADDPVWQRVLLDTVLWTVSLVRGYEQLHASAVRTSGGVVAFLAASGGGKTSLATEFLRRGAVLFADDILALEERDGVVIAHPGPPVMNLQQHLLAELNGDATVLADFGEERWVRVRRSAPAPEPLAAVVLVVRSPGEETRCVPVESPLMVLMANLVGFPYLTDREQSRFELYSTLAATAPVYELAADPAVPTAELADLVGERLGLA